MPAELTARREARDVLLNAVNPLPVIYGGNDPPAAALKYAVLTVISAPTVGTMAGYAYSRVRLQVDVWSYEATDSAVGTLGSQAALALDSAGWNLQEGRLWPPEGPKGSKGERWQRYMLSVTREYSH